MLPGFLSKGQTLAKRSTSSLPSSELKDTTEREELLSSEMGDSLLNDLDNEYQETSASISRQISSLSDLTAKKLSEAIDSIKDNLADCRQVVSDMGFQVRTLSHAEASRWRERIDRYSEDLRTLNRDFERSTESAQRGALLATGDAVAGGRPLSDEQARLMMSMKSEADNTSMLRGAAAELHDTEDRAIEIGDELHTQGQSIRRIKANLGEGSTVLGRIGRGLSRISRRQALMSVMWCCIILIILLVIVLIVYLKFKK